MMKLFYSRFRLALDVVCNNGKLKSDYIEEVIYTIKTDVYGKL